MLALFPLDVLQASNFTPSLLLGVALSTAFWLMVRSEHSAYPVRLLILAGLAWGYASLIRVEALLIAPVFIYWMFSRPRGGKLVHLWVWFGFLAVVAMEIALYYQASAELFYRLKVVTLGGTRAHGASELGMNAAYSAQQLWVFPKAWFITFYKFGLHYYLFFAAIFWTFWRRHKPGMAVAIWSSIYLLWLEFGGNPLQWLQGHFYFKTHLDRYCTSIDVPMAIMIALFLVYALNRWLRALVVLGVVAVALFMISFNTLNLERATASKLGIYHAMSRGWSPLYLDQASYEIADFLVKGAESPFKIHNMQNTINRQITPLDGVKAHLLLNRDFMVFKERRYRRPRVEIEKMGVPYKEVYRVDNPMEPLAYEQIRILSGLVDGFPVAALRDKIQNTAKEVLADGDVKIYRVGHWPGDSMPVQGGAQ